MFIQNWLAIAVGSSLQMIQKKFTSQLLCSGFDYPKKLTINHLFPYQMTIWGVDPIWWLRAKSKCLKAGDEPQEHKKLSGQSTIEIQQEKPQLTACPMFKWSNSKEAKPSLRSDMRSFEKHEGLSYRTIFCIKIGHTLRVTRPVSPHPQHLSPFFSIPGNLMGNWTSCWERNGSMCGFPTVLWESYGKIMHKWCLLFVKKRRFPLLQ